MSHRRCFSASAFVDIFSNLECLSLSPYPSPVSFLLARFGSTNFLTSRVHLIYPSLFQELGQHGSAQLQLPAHLSAYSYCSLSSLLSIPGVLHYSHFWVHRNVFASLLGLSEPTEFGLGRFKQVCRRQPLATALSYQPTPTTLSSFILFLFLFRFLLISISKFRSPSRTLLRYRFFLQTQASNLFRATIEKVNPKPNAAVTTKQLNKSSKS